MHENVIYFHQHHIILNIPIMNIVSDNRSINTRKTGNRRKISQSKVWRTLKRDRMYQMKPLQRLETGYKRRELHFVDWSFKRHRAWVENVVHWCISIQGFQELIFIDTQKLKWYNEKILCIKEMSGKPFFAYRQIGASFFKLYTHNNIIK